MLLVSVHAAAARGAETAEHGRPAAAMTNAIVVANEQPLASGHSQEAAEPTPAAALLAALMTASVVVAAARPKKSRAVCGSCGTDLGSLLLFGAAAASKTTPTTHCFGEKVLGSVLLLSTTAALTTTTRGFGNDDGWWSSTRSAAGSIACVCAFVSWSFVVARSALTAARPHFGSSMTRRRSAWNGHVVCVLLASTANLAGARSFGSANSRSSSVKFTQKRRKLGYVMTNSNIRTAVTAYFDDSSGAEVTYGHILTWETGDVTDMSFLFCSGLWCSYYKSAALSFNEDISAWDTSSVTTMYRMFRGASAFNNPIGDWSIGNVKNMELMFGYAGSFNQAIGDWSVGAVKTMNSMFEGATNFDQDLSDWSVDNVEDMGDMFRFVYAFDQDLGWCVNDGVSLYLAFSGTQCQSTA